MLECYLDDSGTDGESRVVLWGGIVGHQSFMDPFAVAWERQLQEPCEGKPPVKAFHSAHLLNHWGEFKSYNEPEQNRTRFNFRKVILDATLSVIAVGISVEDWNELVVGPLRLHLGDAERHAFALALRMVCQAAVAEDEPISFQFDKGRDVPSINSMIKYGMEVLENAGRPVSYGFSKVACNVGLQGADLVAHESYQLLRNRLEDPDINPNIHLERLLDGAHDAQIAWIGRQQIQEMVNAVSGLLNLGGEP